MNSCHSGQSASPRPNLKSDAPNAPAGIHQSDDAGRRPERSDQIPVIAAHHESCVTGVLLVNLGTPEAATAFAIRRFLSEFLSDYRVVEQPRLLWRPLLYGIILPFRPRRLTQAYKHIWTPQGSPLMQISIHQANALQEHLQNRLGRRLLVELAMTYGKPSIAHGLRTLKNQGARRIFVFPLFPQYSGTTTGAVLDAVFKTLLGERWVPELRTINSYHDHPAYISALSTSVRTHWAEYGRGEHMLLSFHGIPKKYVLAGDPYYCQCQKTARLLAETLQLKSDQYSVAFQSRFGAMPWVQPYTDAKIQELAGSGMESLDVLCPGFAADCLETLEEVALRYKSEFLAAGGKRFSYIPALNANNWHLHALTEIATEQLERWAPELESHEYIRQRETRAAEKYQEMEGRGSNP